MRIRTLILVAGAITAVACSDGGDVGPGPGDEPPEGDVLVQNNSFNPATLEVASGATVVWAWASGGTVHNVTFDDGVSPSGDKGSGTHERTFTAPGDFPYLCTIHGQSMSGVVNVAAPASGDDGGDGNDDPGGPGGPGY